MPFAEGYVLPVDKPLGWTSSDVVRKVKVLLRRLGHRKIKIGHAGTLDPLATGVLLVCIGRATKRAEELQAEQKEYLAGLELGATTPSFDREHPVDRTYPFEHITRESVEEALRGMEGEQWQLPPVYSAKMIDGKRAYEYARRGDEVQMRRALGYAQKISVLGVYLVYGAVLAVTLWQRSGQFWRVLAVPAAVYVLGTLLRAAINRPRPYEALNFTPLFPKDTKGQSMPSRHCFSAAAIVAAAFTVWVPLGVAACLLAAVVAVTRVLTGVHYPSDVLAGLAFGAGAAVIGFLL